MYRGPHSLARLCRPRINTYEGYGSALASLADVRFRGKGGHTMRRARCPLLTPSGHFYGSGLRVCIQVLTGYHCERWRYDSK